MAKLKGNRSIGDATIAQNHQSSGEVTRIQFDSRRIKSDTPNRAQFEPLATKENATNPQMSMQSCRFEFGCQSNADCLSWSMPCTLLTARVGKESQWISRSF